MSATAPFSRSTAKRYWIRSFVPIEKKSACRASRAAPRARRWHLDHHAHLDLLEVDPFLGGDPPKHSSRRLQLAGRGDEREHDREATGLLAGDLRSCAHERAQLVAEQVRTAQAQAGSRGDRARGSPRGRAPRTAAACRPPRPWSGTRRGGRGTLGGSPRRPSSAPRRSAPSRARGTGTRSGRDRSPLRRPRPRRGCGRSSRCWRRARPDARRRSGPARRGARRAPRVAAPPARGGGRSPRARRATDRRSPRRPVRRSRCRRPRAWPPALLRTPPRRGRRALGPGSRRGSSANPSRSRCRRSGRPGCSRSGRRELVRHDHRPLLRPIAGRAHPQEDLHDPVTDVVEVRCARREVLARGRDQELAERLEGADDGSFGRGAGANRFLGQPSQLGVGSELGVGLEDLGLFLAGRRSDAFGELAELCLGPLKRPEEARQLLFGSAEATSGSFVRTGCGARTNAGATAAPGAAARPDSLVLTWRLLVTLVLAELRLRRERRAPRASLPRPPPPR